MEVAINGPAYKHVSKAVNNQRRINLFMSPAGPGGVSDPTKYVMLPTAGKRTMIDCGGYETRAVMNINNTVYVVVDDKVYKLTINDDAGTATKTLIGTLTTSNSGPIYWAANATQIMLVDGTESGGYIITESTSSIQKITDMDFTGASTVVFMDSYFIYNTPDGSTIYATNSSNGLIIDALDVVTAEGQPDNMVGLGVTNRELWAFGAETIEIYWDSANATGFPFSRRDGAFLDIGCGAAGSILNFDNTLVWLDNRGFIVRADNYQPQILSDPGVSAAIRSYNRVDDAKAFKQVDRGELFYIITFPTAKKTWAYGAVSQQWHERAFWSLNAEFEHDLINCHTRYKQYDLIGDRQSGNVYILDANYHLDGSLPIHALSTTPHYINELDQVGVDYFHLYIDTGNQTAGDGESTIWLRYSNDGGYTWSEPLPRSMGSVGEYSKPIIWNRLGSGRHWQLELHIVANQDYSIITGVAGTSPGDPGT